MFKLDAKGRLTNQWKSFGSFPEKIKRKYRGKTFKKKKIYGAGIVVYRNEIFVSGGSVEEDDHALTTIWTLSSRSGQWKTVGEMYTARRDHIMALDPFNSDGLIMCGGYSYRYRYWRFHIKWIYENRNEADVRCEGQTVMSIGGRTRTKAYLYGHKIKYNGGDKSSFDRAQAAYATLPTGENQLIFTSGDTKEGTDHDADVWLLHNDKKATKIGSMRDGVNGIKYWKTWRGNDKAGKPYMGYESWKDYKRNSERDMIFTFGDRIYYYFRPSDDIGREHKHEIWYLDLSRCNGDRGPYKNCLRIDVTNIPKRKHGYMVQVRVTRTQLTLIS